MKTWIKLYTEILRDPKMGRLTDRQYRTCISLFLLAGQVDQNGELPDLVDIAWHLRLDETALRDDMAALEAIGILTCTDNQWNVTRFVDRQARNPSETPEEVGKRVKAHRQRSADVTPCNDTVTACNVSVTASNDIEKKREDTDTELDTDTEVDSDTDKNREEKSDFQQSSALADGVRQYENTIGMVSGAHQAQEIDAMLLDLEERGLSDWWNAALRVAADQNKRSWAYVRGVLTNCLREGRPPLIRGMPAAPAQPQKRVVKLASGETVEAIA